MKRKFFFTDAFSFYCAAVFRQTNNALLSSLYYIIGRLYCLVNVSKFNVAKKYLFCQKNLLKSKKICFLILNEL